MGRFGHAGVAGDMLDSECFPPEAWAAAIENADIAADYAGAFEAAEIDPLDIEDDLFTLVAQRPSRRLRLKH